MNNTEENYLNGKSISKSNTAIETTSEVIYNHYKDQLINSIVDFFTTYDIGVISQTLNDSAFYTAYPNYALELEKKGITNILINQLGLLANISEMYARFWDYYSNSKKEIA